MLFRALDGGALFAKASKEIGPVLLESVESHIARSLMETAEHFAFFLWVPMHLISQDLIIDNSI